MDGSISFGCQSCSWNWVNLGKAWWSGQIKQQKQYMWAKYSQMKTRRRRWSKDWTSRGGEKRWFGGNRQCTRVPSDCFGSRGTDCRSWHRRSGSIWSPFWCLSIVDLYSRLLLLLFSNQISCNAKHPKLSRSQPTLVADPE